MTSVACLVCEGTALIAIERGRQRCVACGFVFGGPSEASREAYATLYASAHGVDVDEARSRHYARLLAAIRPSGNRRALDVGCGGGLFVRLAARAGWTSVGVDPVVTEVEGAGFRLVRTEFPASAAALGPPFALVTFLGSLNYMDDPVATLRAAHDLLEPGGLLFIRVPNVGFHLAVRRASRALGGHPRVARWLARGTILHSRAFSARALGVALRRAGFTDVRIDASLPVPGDPYGSGAAAIGAIKLLVGAFTSALSAAPGRRVLWAPSLEARAVRTRC